MHRAAGPDTQPADMLADVALALELFEQGEAVEMLELSRRFPDSVRWTGGDAGPAFGTPVFNRPVRSEVEVCEHGHQPHLSPEPRSDEQVVSTQPAKTRANGDTFVRQVTALVLPVN